MLDGLALFNTESCTLLAVDVATGALVWDKWLGDPLLAQPAAAGEHVFMVYPRQGKHWLAAFRMRTGEPVWETPLAHDVITAPVLAEGKLYVATYDGIVTCLDPAAGALCWTKAMDATSAPWICDGRVFVSHRTSGERASRAGTPAEPAERTLWLNVADGAPVAASQAKSAAYLHRSWGAGRKSAFVAQDAAVGFAQAPAAARMDLVSHLVGEEQVSRACRYQGSRPVVHDRVLFETTGDRLDATSLDTGQEIRSWTDARAEEGERRLTPPAVANGRVLIGTWDGRIISLDSSSGDVRWAVAVGAPCHWQPVMAGGRVFAGLEDGSLVAFETGDSDDDGWPMWGGGPGHNGS